MHTFSAVAFIATATLAYICLSPLPNAVALVALLVTLQVYRCFFPKKAIKYHKPMLILLLLALAIPGSWRPAILPQTHLPRKTPHSPTLTNYITESWNKRAGGRDGYPLLAENRAVSQYYKPNSVTIAETFLMVPFDEELMIYKLPLEPPRGMQTSGWTGLQPPAVSPIQITPYNSRSVLTGLSGVIGGGFEAPSQSGEGSWTKIIGLPYPFSKYKTVSMWVGNLGGFVVALMLVGPVRATQATAAVLPTRASLLAWNRAKVNQVVHGFTGLLHRTQPNDAERGEERRLIEDGDGRRDATLLDLDDDEQQQHQQQSLTYGAVHRG